MVHHKELGRRVKLAKTHLRQKGPRLRLCPRRRCWSGVERLPPTRAQGTLQNRHVKSQARESHWKKTQICCARNTNEGPQFAFFTLSWIDRGLQEQPVCGPDNGPLLKNDNRTGKHRKETLGFRLTDSENCVWLPLAVAHWHNGWIWMIASLLIVGGNLFVYCAYDNERFDWLIVWEVRTNPPEITRQRNFVCTSGPSTLGRINGFLIH